MSTAHVHGGHLGTWALGGHSASGALRALKHLDTRALKALGPSGIWALETICLADLLQAKSSLTFQAIAECRFIQTAYVT